MRANRDSALCSCESQFSCPEEVSLAGQWSLCSCLGTLGTVQPAPPHCTWVCHFMPSWENKMSAHELPGTLLAVFILSGASLMHLFILQEEGSSSLQLFIPEDPGAFLPQAPAAGMFLTEKINHRWLWASKRVRTRQTWEAETTGLGPGGGASSESTHACTWVSEQLWVSLRCHDFWMCF